MRKKHKIAILGCGRISGKHIEACDSTDRVELTTLCDSDKAAAETKAGGRDGLAVIDSIDQLAADESIDVVIVATPPDVRLEVVRPLLEASKHLLVEKPFANSIAEAEIMVAVADQQQVKLAVNQNFRFLEESQQIKALLDKGKLGTPFFMSQLHSCWRNEEDGWRNTTERLALAVMGTHWLDRFRWLFGQEAHSIFAHTFYSGLLDSEGEDLANVTIEFPSGCLASLTEQWNSRGQGGANYFQMDCTEGSVILRDGILKAVGSDRESLLEQPVDADFGPTFAKSLLELLDAIDEDREPMHSGLNNLGTTALLEGAYISAEEGSKFSIGEEESSFGA
jgi:predicted dehydrogenase